MVLLDSKTVKGRPFTHEHAEEILNYQEKYGFKDWSLSKKQGMVFKDGKIKDGSTRGKTDKESTKES